MTVTGSDLAKVAGALSRPLVKLIEVVESGIGALGHPFLVIMNAHAEGRARLIRAGYDHQLKKLKVRQREELEAAKVPIRTLPGLSMSNVAELGPDEVEVIFDDAASSELVAARVLETQQQAKRRANVVTIAAEAADHVGTEVAEDPVDPDWIARFFSYAQDVSNEELQQLWGRVLAGEVGRPGKVPLRTLDLLRNMTKRDAELLLKLGSRTALDSNYLPYGAGGLTSGELLLAQDAGFIHPDERSLQWHAISDTDGPPRAPRRPRDPFEEVPGQRDLRYPSGYVLRITTNSTMYQVATYVVRPSAIPLLNLIRPSLDVAYLQSLVEALNAQSHFQASLTAPST